MKIHEYQAKNLFRKNNICVPEGAVSNSLEDALCTIEKIKYPCVIKAQVHSGARGKAGGIKLVKNENEARIFVKKIMGTQLITTQNAPSGQPVNHILFEQPCLIKKELYLGILIDREYEKICIIASAEGGMEIEELATNTPEKIVKQWIDPSIDIKEYNIRNLHKQLRLSEKLYKNFSICVRELYNLFIANDVSLMEINPLAISKDDGVVALDAKIDFDDNALYRLSNIVPLMDKKQENDREVLAKENNLNYIALDGNIGCLVNGAGLAMSTMDIIKYVGGEPANFLDVGGGATEDNVKNALKLILDDSKVETVLINVFGGIARCDVIAQGIVEAAKEIKIDRPLIVRLEGTKVEEGKKILEKSTLKIISASNLLDAAEKAVKSIKK
jgi:succinyl-CoA synthetase beta subunit